MTSNQITLDIADIPLRLKRSARANTHNIMRGMMMKKTMNEAQSTSQKVERKITTVAPFLPAMLRAGRPISHPQT